jgi:hypothetical protein
VAIEENEPGPSRLTGIIGTKVTREIKGGPVIGRTASFNPLLIYDILANISTRSSTSAQRVRKSFSFLS